MTDMRVHLAHLARHLGSDAFLRAVVTMPEALEDLDLATSIFRGDFWESVQAEGSSQDRHGNRGPTVTDSD